eukprot:scaffold28122_cov65-Phaeocystis_antarctica.AAC.1
MELLSASKVAHTTAFGHPGVVPPTTSVDAQVTIAVSVLGSDQDAYATLQSQSSTVQAQAGSVDAKKISSTLTAAVPNLAANLAVTAPTQTVVETNAPPSAPPPLPPPPPSPPLPVCEDSDNQALDTQWTGCSGGYAKNPQWCGNSDD